MNCSWFFLCKVWDWSWPMWDKQVWCIHEVNSVLCPLLSHLVYIHLFIILGDRIFGNCGKILDIGMENKTNNAKIKCCCPNLHMHLYTVCVAFCICHFPHVMICSNIYTTIIFVPQCLFWYMSLMLLFQLPLYVRKRNDRQMQIFHNTLAHTHA